MMSAAVSPCAAATSEPVFACPYFGKHLGGGFAGKADRGSDLRLVGTQEHIGPFFIAHAARDGRRARRDLPLGLRGAGLQSGIAGLDRQREADIGVGVFVAAKNRSV